VHTQNTGTQHFIYMLLIAAVECIFTQ